MDTYTIQLEIKSATTKEIKKVVIEKDEIKTIKSLLDLGLRHRVSINLN